MELIMNERKESENIIATPTDIANLNKELQTILNNKGAKLNVDGIIGEKTIAALKRHNVNKGEKGEFVKIVQELLNSKGYDCGTPDGIAGNLTIQAICNAAWDKLLR